MASPACEAWIVHVPAAWMVTVDAATVQTGVASEVKLTARPDDAVALIVNGAAPKLLPLSAAKLIGLTGERSCVERCDERAEPAAARSSPRVHNARMPRWSTLRQVRPPHWRFSWANRSGKFVGRKRIRYRRESRHATPVAIISAAVSSYRNSAEFDRSSALAVDVCYRVENACNSCRVTVTGTRPKVLGGST